MIVAIIALISVAAIAVWRNVRDTKKNKRYYDEFDPKEHNRKL